MHRGSFGRFGGGTDGGRDTARENGAQISDHPRVPGNGPEGDEDGKRGVHAVAPRRQIVAELVASHDRDQRQAEGEPEPQPVDVSIFGDKEVERVAGSAHKIDQKQLEPSRT